MPFKGPEWTEFIEQMSQGRRAQLTINGKTYVVAPEQVDTENYDLTLRETGRDGACVHRVRISPARMLARGSQSRGMVGDSALKQLFTDKCFDGKSLVEMARNQVVDVEMI